MAEDRYVQLVYFRIIALALAAHVSYVAIFALLKLPGMVAYNLCSALFYCAMQLAARRGAYRLVVSSIHVEVCIFAVVSTLAVGWEIGAALYLIALISLTYFCPFRHKWMPYVFSVLEIVVFLGLALYMRLACPGRLTVSETVGLWLFVYNACGCFIIIIYAAFSSKVSAAVSRQELQDENLSLSALANYDELTGFLTRHAFLTKMDKPWDGLVALALGDIDDFKVINDTWGHLCGDQVLSESAELIRRELESTVSVCRWGGEEFLFLFTGLPLGVVEEKVRELCTAIAAHPFRFGQAEFHITMTFGIGMSSEVGTREELIALADRRMYEGKALGKNRVV